MKSIAELFFFFIKKKKKKQNKFVRGLKKVGKALYSQWFMVGMISSILLAFLIPQLGRTNGPLKPEITVNYVAICMVFFFTGMSIKILALKNAFLSIKHQLSKIFF